MLMVKCKSCHKKFPSSVKYDRRSFEEVIIVDQGEICPHCSTVSTFNWEDYFFES